MRLLLILLALVLPTTAAAVDRYISPSGSNSNSCSASTSSSTPKQTFHDTSGTNGAVRCMASGDRLIMMNGTYPKFLDDDSTNLIPNGPDAAHPTTFIVRAGDTVTATGASGTVGDKGIVMFNNTAGKANITIDGGVNCGANSSGAACKLIFNGTGNISSALVNIGPSNNHIIITNFELYGTNNNGVGFGGDNNTLSNCNIHNNGDNSSTSSAYGIYQGNGDDNIIEHCSVHHNGGYGIHVNACDANQGSTDCNGENHTTHRGKYRYNDIFANGQFSTLECAGLLVGGFSQDVEAYGNLVHDNTGACGGIQFYRPVNGGKIYNNTVTRNARYGIDMNAASNILVTNNLVGDNNLIPSGGTNFSNIQTATQSSGNVYTTNGCFGSGGTGGGGCNASVTANFVNAGAGNFKLYPSSTAIDQGTVLTSPYNAPPYNVDFAGIARPQGGGYEIGAYEYVATIITPPTPQLVLALPLDEGGGSIATDVSGQKNNATLVGGASWTTGQYGGAIALDGTGYLNVPAAASLALAPAMTLEAWVYPTADPSGFSTVIRQDRYFLYAASDAGYCPAPALASLGGYSTTVINSICATSMPPLNTWSHLAVTHDGLTLTFYLNGNIVASQTSTDPMVPTSYSLTIGASQFGENFVGRIDQPMVYNYSRTQPQIVSDMKTPLIGGPGKYVDIAAPASVEISSSASIEISAD